MPAEFRNYANQPPAADQSALLPTQLNSFVGRAVERRRVLDLLSSTRLLTLTGAGGVGKTRLAPAVLRELKTDRHTTGSFINLAPLSDPDLVPQTVAAQLGVPEQLGRACWLASSMYSAARQRSRCWTTVSI